MPTQTAAEQRAEEKAEGTGAAEKRGPGTVSSSPAEHRKYSATSGTLLFKGTKSQKVGRARLGTARESAPRMIQPSSWKARTDLARRLRGRDKTRANMNNRL